MATIGQLIDKIDEERRETEELSLWTHLDGDDFRIEVSTGSGESRLACSRHFDRKTLSEIESEAAAGLLLETLRRGEPKPPPKAGEIFPGITLHDGSTDEHPGVSVDCEIPEGEPLPLFAKELRRTIHTAIAATDTHARDLALELSPHVARCLVWTDETYAQSQELLGIPCTVVAPPGPMAQLIISEGERPTVACVLIPEHPPETEEENA